MGASIKAKIRGAWKSWTIWLNGVALAALPVIDMLKESVPQLERYVDAQSYKFAMLAVIVSNIVLRVKTSTGLQNK